MNDCEALIQDYLRKLEGDFRVESSNGGCLVVTPFSRPDGEAVEVVLEKGPDGQLRLTDMGDTFGYLYVNGVAISRTMLEDAKKVGTRFGVKVQGSELFVSADPTTLGEALHGLTQAILSVTDFIQKKRPMEQSRFDDDVEAVLVSAGLTYDSDYQVEGLRNYHRVRFHLDSGRNLLIQPLSPTSEQLAFSWAERWAYRFGDIREKGSFWRCHAILDDREERAGVWSQRASAPLQEYGVFWSNKERLTEVLSGVRQEI